MMKSFWCCVATAALLLPAAAVAGDDPPEGKAYVANSDDLPPGEKVICRRDKVIGSRLASKKVCKTAAQWEADAREARQAVEKGQNQRTYRSD